MGKTEDIRAGLSDFDRAMALFDDQLFAGQAVSDAAYVLYNAAQEAAVVLRRSRQGRLIYSGAGTPARLGYVDGSELPPTFGWPKERLGYVIAGGERAILEAVEGAEDNKDGDAQKQVERLSIDANDVFIGVSASGTTPFTLAAAQEAKKRGALVIAFANNQGAPLLDRQNAHYPALLETGSELIGGSTRMKAGAAQKIALSNLSTMVMINLGFQYEGHMVAVRPTNDKLKARAQRIIQDVSGCDADRAAKALKASERYVEHGDARLGILMAAGRSYNQSVEIMDRHEWNLGQAVERENIRFSRSSRGPSCARA
jgi:N-acetylmuramic acid 6-phosphate etherase